MPTHTRGQLLDQMPTLHKTYQDHHSYASATVERLTKDQSEEILAAHVLASGTLINQGDGKFTWTPFPNECQISPVLGLEVVDLNDDGYHDLITVGNLHGQRVEYGRQDAGYGCLLFGHGNGSFSFEGTHHNPGNTRALSSIYFQNRVIHLVTRSDGNVSSFITTPSKSVKKIAVPPGVNTGIVFLNNGMSRKIEIYRGQGYLSQVDARHVVTMADSIHWYDMDNFE